MFSFGTCTNCDFLLFILLKKNARKPKTHASGHVANDDNPD